MPNPRELKVGDRVRFIGIPEAWMEPGFFVSKESRAFMKVLIARRGSSRINSIDEFGYPWITARVRHRNGTLEHHAWMITETTGWLRVRRRAEQADSSARTFDRRRVAGRARRVDEV
jgi:hypothetical protein